LKRVVDLDDVPAAQNEWTRMEGVDRVVVKLANVRAYLSTCVLLSRLMFSRQALCWWLVVYREY
jgi:hypothetical protein